MRTAVLIPCFNEAQTIAKVTSDFRRALPHAEIYVYDNNSTDGTAEAALGADVGVIVRHAPQQGKGNVVRRMFRDIDADCYIMADGDDTYPAEYAPLLERMVLEEGVDMAVGDRLSSTYFTENKRPFHNSGNVLVRKLINVLFKAELHDIMTGLRAFSRDFVKSFPVVSQGFEIETEMTVFALDCDFHVKEVPIEYRDRPAGSESKLNTFSDGFKVLKTIALLFRNTRPFSFFSTIAAVLLLVCSILFIPIWSEFLQTGLVPRIPTLIVICALAMIAILHFFCGLVLSVLKKQYRDDFERHIYLLRYITRRNKAA